MPRQEMTAACVQRVAVGMERQGMSNGPVEARPGGCHNHPEGTDPPTLTELDLHRRCPWTEADGHELAQGLCGWDCISPQHSSPTSPQRLVQSYLLSRRSVTQESRRK